jgi:hypothetical protein
LRLCWAPRAAQAGELTWKSRFDVVSVAERVWSRYLALLGDPAGVKRTSESTVRVP